MFYYKGRLLCQQLIIIQIVKVIGNNKIKGVTERYVNPDVNFHAQRKTFNTSSTMKNARDLMLWLERSSAWHEDSQLQKQYKMPWEKDTARAPLVSVGAQILLHYSLSSEENSYSPRFVRWVLLLTSALMPQSLLVRTGVDTCCTVFLPLPSLSISCNTQAYSAAWPVLQRGRSCTQIARADKFHHYCRLSENRWKANDTHQFTRTLESHTS